MNIYYNPSNTTINHSELMSHWEHNKFSYVGQASIQSNGVECWLCFNLKSAHHNGDVKVLLKDKSGFEAFEDAGA